VGNALLSAQLFDPDDPTATPATVTRSIDADETPVLLRVTEAARRAREADEALSKSVAEARGQGLSWRMIGQAAEVPFQTLHARADRTGRGRPRPSGADRSRMPDGT
jgi:hypothetical protein